MSTRKLYIDSRLCEGTGSDFVYNLRQSVECPQGTAALIDEVLCPDTFLTVDANRKYLYLKEIDQSSGVSQAKVRAELPEGMYDGLKLAAAITVALNQVKTVSPNYTCAYSELAGRLAIHNSKTWQFHACDNRRASGSGCLGQQPFWARPSGCQ